MARMRQAKQLIKGYLEGPDWQRHLGEIAAGGAVNVAPLFALLPGEARTMHRAALALGRTCAGIAEKSPEQARNIVRRFMWHLNEESGNIGWGIPEAFGETLAASRPLAREFHKILISYVIDLGRDDNFCDNDILRRSCFWAIGRLAEAWPDLAGIARPWLRKGLEDRDAPCRGMAAWALGKLPPDIMDAPLLRRLAEAGRGELCTLFDGNEICERSVSQLAREALAR